MKSRPRDVTPKQRTEAARFRSGFRVALVAMKAVVTEMFEPIEAEMRARFARVEAAIAAEGKRMRYQAEHGCNPPA